MFDIVKNEPEIMEVKPTSNNGFHVYLKNGYRVSVQWGEGTYSNNHDVILNFTNPADFYAPMQSSTAEVAVIHPKNGLIVTPFNSGNTVIGWQSPADVIKIIKWASTLTEDYTYKPEDENE